MLSITKKLSPRKKWNYISRVIETSIYRKINKVNMNVKHINTEYKYQQEDVDIKWYVCFARSTQEVMFSSLQK